MKLVLYGWLESLLAAIGSWALRQSERFALCSQCGRNRYTGIPCYGGKQ
jgi:hypothetical protein